MKNRFKKMLTMLIALLMVLSACGTQEVPDDDNTPEPPTEPQSLTITVALGDAQDTLLPTYSTADGGETILLHLYENLMRWEDDGNGYATLVPGQAESYTVETDYLGNATYTFNLRDDIVWSDGQPVTAYQFVAAWQRLADPAYASPHSELVKCIAGYSDVQSTGDASLLAVSSPDAQTFVVKLSGNVPYFLDVVCAGAYTMPIRTYLPGNQDAQFVTNGAYALAEFTSEMVRLVKREDYYDSANVSLDEICFVPASDSATDYEKLLGGVTAFSENLPTSVLQELASDENWTSEPVTSTYALIINTLQPPFDNADVRAAFRLAVDEQAILNALGDYTSRPATGLIPYGVTDRGAVDTEEEKEQTEEARLPDPNAPVSEKEGLVTYYDFRAHGEEIVTLDISVGYDLDCTWARTLLADAGYDGGAGFPEVEYIYVDSQENRVVAESLRAAWREVLGVTVTLRALTAEEYELMLRPAVDDRGKEIAPAAFYIAATEITADYNDAYAFLARWHSESSENVGKYSSAAFDILLEATEVAATPESYDAYLHDAEAVLMEESPVIPVFYRGGSYAISEKLEGLYRAPNGVYFFNHVTRVDTGDAE